MGEDAVAIVTIASASYYARVKTLAESVAVWCKHVPFYWVSLEDLSGVFDERFLNTRGSIVHAEVIVPDLRTLSCTHDVVELATVIKPMVISYFLNNGHQSVLFLDPDTFVVGDIAELFHHLNSASSVMLPHWTEPSQDEAIIARDLLRLGAYNLGMVGFTAVSSGLEILDWWHRQVQNACFRQQEAGIFLDQKYADLFPALFDGVSIIRNPSYNIAWWNIQARRNTPPRVYHFSGLDPDHLPSLTRHYPALSVADVPTSFQRAIHTYVAQIRRNSDEALSTLAVEAESRALHRDVPYIYREYSRATRRSYERHDVTHPGNDLVQWADVRLREIYAAEQSTCEDSIRYVRWLTSNAGTHLLGSLPLQSLIVAQRDDSRSASDVFRIADKGDDGPIPLWERCECGRPKPGRFG